MRLLSDDATWEIDGTVCIYYAIGKSTQLGAGSVGDAVAMQAVGRVCPVTIGQDSMS